MSFLRFGQFEYMLTDSEGDVAVMVLPILPLNMCWRETWHRQWKCFLEVSGCVSLRVKASEGFWQVK